MRMAVLLCCALLTGAASPTFAGLDITTVACNTGPGHSSTFNFDCSTDGTPQVLFGCFQLPTAQDSVVAVDNVFDLSIGDAGLPDWWHFETGGCNSMTSLGHATVFADLARSTTLCIGATDAIISISPNACGALAVDQDCSDVRPLENIPLHSQDSELLTRNSESG